MNASGRSELQMRRALLAALAAFDLVGLITTQTVVGRLDPLALPDWYRIVFFAGFLMPVAAAIIGPFVGERGLHRVTVVGFLGAVTPVVALLVLAIVDPSLEGQLPWMISSASAAAAAAVLAWGTGAGWLALAGIAIANWTISALVGDLVPHRVSNDTQALVFAVVAILLFGALLRSSEAIDRATEAGRSAAEQRAAAQARRAAAERARVFVHDEVLGTLLQAARGTPEVDPMLAAQAASAASGVRALATPEITGEVPLEELRRRLAELARAESPGSTFAARIGPQAPRVLPAVAALALVAATRQALVNAMRHAPGAAVTLTLVAGVHGVRVITADDGPGFDPEAVAADRLGISASILGRLREVPGGEAKVEAAPGEGAAVTVAWQGEDTGRRDQAGQPADDPRAAQRDDRSAGMPAVGTDGAAGVQAAGTDAAAGIAGVAGIAQAAPRLAGDPRIALVLLVLSMTALAIYSAAIVAEPWVPALAIVLLLTGLAVLGWTPMRRPSVPRSIVAVVLGIAATMLVAAGEIVDYRLMTGWYATAAAFLMSVLAMRGRPFLAMLGTGGGVVLAAALSVARGASVVDIVAVLFRPVLIGVGVALVVLLLAALARRVRRLGEAEVEAASAEAWRDAERAELQERWAGLDAFIGPTLDRLAEGRPLSDAERQECALVEGALRDRYRGARLAREPLIGAARRARARGVDVVLLDDANAEEIDEGELLEIATWLAAFLDRVQRGAFTGRILPADRPGRASASSDTEATLFRGEDAFSRSQPGS